jgi:diguanylate cyclase
MPASFPPEHDLAFLQQQLQDRETEISLLSETANCINSELNLETLFQLVTERVKTLINAETVLLPLLDADCQHYTYRAGSGKNIDEIIGESLPLDFGVCGWVWRNKRPWWRGVLQELEAVERNQWEKEAGTIILVPLFGKRHFLGGIVGINKLSGEDFSKRDLDLLTLFANQVSSAIENATFFEEINAARQQAVTYQLELKTLNAELERRVAARTAELAGVNVQLTQMALHDSLTGLPNRALIKDRLKYSLTRARRDKTPVSVMLLDLDRFKEINDTLGHHVGDTFLIEIASRLCSALREADTVGRLGGDEFAIILPATPSPAAEGVAKKIIEALEKSLEIEGSCLAPAGSLGIVTFPDHGQNESDLLRFADVAMYEAKRSCSGYMIYDGKDDLNNRQQLTLVSDLRNAIKAREFILHYQPQIDLFSGEIRRVEALARWQHPVKGLIAPDIFIPVLEKTGLIKPFTYWALDCALEQWSAWHDAGISAPCISVNLSMRNITDPTLHDQLSALLKKWNVAGSCLMLEITESCIMSDPDMVINILSRLKAETGVQFSIDDFGTGYSSLMYLKRMPVSEIKIDKSFVMDMSTDSQDAMIVLSTIYMAQNLGLEVVAEGVETQEIYDALCRLKCDTAQGYFISRPLPANELLKFINTRNDQRRLADQTAGKARIR